MSNLYYMSIVAPFIVFMIVAITDHLRNKRKMLDFKQNLRKVDRQVEAMQYKITTERVVREREFDDNFCRTCKAVVRPAGHFCYSCGMPYPLKKEKA